MNGGSFQDLIYAESNNVSVREALVPSSSGDSIGRLRHELLTSRDRNS